MTAPEASEQTYVIQFPHPGREHNPGSADVMPWRITNPHARKFLRTTGRYLTGDGASTRNAELVFWGEWEAPSDVVARWDRTGDLPRFLHEPFWTDPPTPGFRQNTDPWVFGQAFRYSNCKQPHYRSLRELTPGSMILFGSARHRLFRLDTVLVVGNRAAERYQPQHCCHLEVDDAFRACTLDSIATTDSAREELILYEGATVDNPVHGMYSFVPARRGDDPQLRFRCPSVSVPRYVTPNLGQGLKNTRVPTIDETFRVWKLIRDQVIDQGLLLAVELAAPPYREPAHPGKGGSSRGC